MSETIDTSLPEVFNFLNDVEHSQHSMPKGAFVFRENEGCGRIGFVLSGTIRVYKENPNGRSITLYRIGPGESCILSMTCVLSNPIQQASAVIEEDAEVITVPANEFRKLMEKSQEAKDYVFSLFATRLTDVLLLLDEVVFQRMDERLAAILLENSARHGSDEVLATHEQLAEDAGTAREVVTRVLREFSMNNWVAVSRGKVKILDRKGLSHVRRS